MTDRAEVPVTLENLQAAAARTKWENRLHAELRRSGLPTPDREHYFALALGRSFRLDFAWPDRKLAVEVQGGGWMPADKLGRRRGAHGGGEALERDCEKFALASALGWRVVPVTPAQIKDGRAVRWIEAALEWDDLAGIEGTGEAEGWRARMCRAFAIKGSPAAWGVAPVEPTNDAAPVTARVMG